MLRRIGASGLKLMVLGLTLSLCGCPAEFPVLSPGVVRTTGLVYGLSYVGYARAEGFSLEPQFFDLMESVEGEQEMRPAVIAIHGGGFVRGSKEKAVFVLLCDLLATQGYVCFLMNYRLAGDHPPSPAELEGRFIADAAHAACVDAKAMIRHVRTHSDYYGVDPNRIALVGGSAGAITSLLAGLSDQGEYAADGQEFPVPALNNPGADESVSALVSLWGTAQGFLGEFDPQDPPVMVVHGSEDQVVGNGLEPAQAIVDQCISNGIPYRYYPIYGAGHAPWDAEVDGAGVNHLILDFLDAYLAS